MNEWEKSVAAGFAKDMKEYSNELLNAIQYAINVENQRRLEIDRIAYENALKENS